MTIHKITAGDGYTYLTRQVAAGDASPERGRSAAEYYTATGNPPGVWMGRGLEALGVVGPVSEEQMVALFGLGRHPDADAIAAQYLREHVTAGMSERQLAIVAREAGKAASLGRPFPEYRDLGPFDERVAARLEAIRRETGRAPSVAEEKKVKREEARRQRRAVAGFDLVFTPVSSVSRLWGLDPRPWVREAIEQAHAAARDAAIRLLEQHAAHTRTGSSGQAQIETRGLIAAVFDHADNRLGEPNLHSHVAVSAKVLGVDGRWRALDARGLYRMTVAASELYNTVLEHELHARLGLEFATRPDTAGKREPVREIAGFPTRVLAHFTRRRTEIETEYRELLAAYRAAHGRDPSLAAAHELAQQATLATRKGKKPARAWAAMREQWRAELVEEFGPSALDEVLAIVPRRGANRTPIVTAAELDVAAVAARVVAEVQEHHATWTRWSVLAQAERELRGMRFVGRIEQERAVAAVVEAAVSQCSIPIEPPELLAEPAALRRTDGASVFTQHGAGRYTSRAILDAEARLVDAARCATTVGVDGQSTNAALAGYEQRTGRELDPGQRALVTAFACDGRLLLAGIGPAGTGKTTAMKALAEVIRTGGCGRLVPLASSASAAGVLGQELGVKAENLHKFLWEFTNGTHASDLAEGRGVPGMEFFTLQPGDVILIDEAGMAGTLNLDRLVAIAARHGAVVRLLGDYRQLGAVESGGALRLIANEAGAVELDTLYRFTDPDEAAATLKLRTGDTAGLEFYQHAGRICGGSHQAMTGQVYAGWKTDMLAGRKALMVAATNAEVAALSARARADRVAAGQVEPGGIVLHDGNLAGVGDWITTRDNNRTLRAGVRDFVKNGDAWIVLDRRSDGALLVQHLTHRGRVLLPPEYVANNVELLYATTAHRAQGSTVDACHALVTEQMGRENLYVIASRARTNTMLYVATHELAALDEDEHVDAVRFDAQAYVAREILEHVVARKTAERSATEQVRASFAEAVSLATLVPRYEHALDVAADAQYRRLVNEVLPDLAEEITEDPAWHAVHRALREADAAGWNTPTLLVNAARSRELGTAESVAEVISWRLHRIIDHEQPAAIGRGNAAGDRRNDVERDHVRALHKVLGTTRVNHARNEPAWPALLLALRRADDLGHDVAHILTAAIDRRELRSAAYISEHVALAVHQHLDKLGGEARAVAPLHAAVNKLDDTQLLPWLRADTSVNDADWRTYLDAHAELIRRRINVLADTAAATRPAWAAHLGEPPTAPAERTSWLRHLATIAAYRDQYQVTDDEPDHPLGPYPENGRVGHRAYWHAAASVLAMRGGTGHAGDPSRARLAADRYRTLPADEQDRIATELAQRLGEAWLGNTQDLAADADHPVYRDQLADILAEHGHLDAHESAAAAMRSTQPTSARSSANRRPQRPSRRIQTHPKSEAVVTRPNAPARRPESPTPRPPQTPTDQSRAPRPTQ